MENTPKCFTPMQFIAWKEAEKMTPHTLSSYCADCTPEFQSRMIQCGKCEHPGTTFHFDGDHVDGERPQTSDWDGPWSFVKRRAA